ncbi:MAG TPA: MFS transporter [Sphingomonas sp.]|nr:MFS transporter [Sphingomonas sp.]
MTIFPSTRSRQAALTIVGVMLIAFNLRPALTSVSPVLPSLADSLSLSVVGQSVLTTLPVLFLGLAAPLAPWSARRIGVERAALAAVAILIAALAVRPYVGIAGLFAGTLVAGACIGVAGVLLPAIVKRDFPRHQSLLTGLYTAALCVGASAAAGATEPLRLAFGGHWRSALAIWAVPALVAAAIWWWRTDREPPTPNRAARAAPLHRDRLAWQITGYMGLQSALAYTVFGWLPTMLQDRGLDPVTAGLALSASIMIQVSTAIGAPWLGSRMRDQRLVLVIVTVMTLIGLAGCLYAPIAGVWLWVVVLGLGQGGTFSMALTLLALRARDAETAGRLSGMAQGVGYTIAALGPLFVGLLHEAFHGWHVPGLFLGSVGVAALWMAMGAGRPLYVLDGAAADPAVR